MASVPLLIFGGFFVLVGFLVMFFSIGEGFVVILIGMLPIGIGLVWGVSGSDDSAGTAGPTECPRCGQPNSTGNLYCTGCGLYLALPT